MHRILANALVLVSVLALAFVGIAGCKKTWTREEQDQIVKKIEVGVTNMEYVRNEASRSPDAVYRRDGYEYWTWTILSAEEGRGGAPVTKRVFTLKFDDNGVVQGYSNEVAH